MALTLTIRNRQRTRAVDVGLLRRITRSLLGELLRLPVADLGILVVAEPEMIRLNETFLHHAGSTDVITFDYANGTSEPLAPLSLGRVRRSGLSRRAQPTPEKTGLGRVSVLECASPLAPSKSWGGESARGLAHSKTLRRCEPVMESDGGRTLQGEIFVCVHEAIVQARRFRTSWQAELVRYIVHGVLHLRGFDDHAAADRRRMKREEARLLRLLAERFPLSRLARKR